MSNSTKRLSMVLTFVAVVAMLGLKDTGVFLKDFTYKSEDVVYSSEEKVAIDREDEQYFYISNKGIEVKIPKNVMIKTSIDNKNIIALKSTKLFDKVNGNVIRIVLSDEFLEIVSLEGDFYKARTAEGVVGFINKKDTKPVSIEARTLGKCLTDTFLVNDELLYELKKGEYVEVTDFINSQYIIKDPMGNVFKVNADEIELQLPEIIAEVSDINLDDIQVVAAKKASNTVVAPAPVAVSAEALSKVSKILNYAEQQLDKPYVYADTGKTGYDCSGLMYDLYVNQLGISIPRSSYDQVEAGVEVERNNLQAGDLVFFNTTDTPNSHVGMYIGDGNFIHASSGSGKVVITELDSNYYSERYSTARRIILDV